MLEEQETMVPLEVGFGWNCCLAQFFRVINEGCVDARKKTFGSGTLNKVLGLEDGRKGMMGLA